MYKKYKRIIIAFISLMILCISYDYGYTPGIQWIKENEGQGQKIKNYRIKQRSNLAESLENNSLLVLFSGDEPGNPDYDYTPDRNFYYLTGIDQEKTVLVIIKTAGKTAETLFIKEQDPKIEKWTGKVINIQESGEVSGIENVLYLGSLSSWLDDKIKSDKIRNVYLDLGAENNRENEDNVLTAAIGEFSLNRPEYFADVIGEKYKALKIINVNKYLTRLRTIKSEEEIQNIRKAIYATSEGINNLMKNAKPGMREYELESYFDYSLKSQGIRHTSFNTIMASGKNGTILHYRNNGSRIGKNDLVMFDLGAQYNYYCADISRTIPASGKFSERQKEIYNIVLKAEMETIKEVKPGIRLYDLQQRARKVLAEGCRRIGLIKNEAEIEQYFYHSVTHHLGLHDHDDADYSMKLEPGMVITIEPGLYIKEEGMGIRVEDDVAVTKDGCEVLSKGIIKTPEEIESFMNEK